MEQHHFNTYSSTHHSNARRTLYLALNRHGQPRKIQIPPSRPLGKLATYTKSLTQTVEQSRVERLIARNFGPNYIKHGLKQLCDSGIQIKPLTDKSIKPKPKCNLQNKIKKQVTKKKKRRKCRDDEPEGDHCSKTVVHSSSPSGPGASVSPKKKQLQAQNNKNQQKCNSSNEKDEDCVNNLGNKKRPITKKIQRPLQQQNTGLKKGKQQPVEIVSIHRLHGKVGSPKKLTTKTTTTTAAPSLFLPSTTDISEDLSLEEDEEFEDILVDPQGHNMQFVDDEDTHDGD